MHARKMAGHVIRRLNQISTQVFTSHMQAAGLDLTPVQFAAMDAITSNPGVDQASVAAMIAYDRATIGGVIDRLVHKGYVDRTISSRDRRARELRMTSAGSKAYDMILPRVASLQSEILSDLSPTEIEHFLALARKAAGIDLTETTPSV